MPFLKTFKLSDQIWKKFRFVAQINDVMKSNVELSQVFSIAILRWEEFNDRIVVSSLSLSAGLNSQKEKLQDVCSIIITTLCAVLC